MNDTSPAMAARMEKMSQQKTGAQRLLMGCSMFDLSKQLMKSAILKEKPRVSIQELRRELFLRFYGSDLKGSKQKILAHLRRNLP